MSVGGRVIEAKDCGDKVWINTKERYWSGSEWRYGEECAIYVERNEDSLNVRFRDTIWWQGRRAYWTQRSGPAEEKPIKRIGYSGVSRPT